MERAEIIKPGFSTADVGCPQIEMVESKLVLRFKDWKGNEVMVIFPEVVAFKWHMIERLIPGEDFDGSHLIVDSEWLMEHLRQEKIGSQEGCEHYKFNFNDSGQLEVISHSFIVKN
ncbi:hypothetical protein [Microbulbifer litoralis]|uniref:hypothetical protein n=1 Tax=Microbulbifer litoralis TaxID=2933965 RepID=UPI002027CDB7|nr:hypothetical protein [Microbulbifer sp. GX H0434]